MSRTDSAKLNYFCVPYVLSCHSVIGETLSAKLNDFQFSLGCFYFRMLSLGSEFVNDRG